MADKTFLQILNQMQRIRDRTWSGLCKLNSRKSPSDDKFKVLRINRFNELQDNIGKANNGMMSLFPDYWASHNNWLSDCNKTRPWGECLQAWDSGGWIEEALKNLPNSPKDIEINPLDWADSDVPLIRNKATKLINGED